MDVGVRIIPPQVKFKDTDVNTVYRVNITAKNVSKTCKSIRYYGPKTENFVLKVKNPDKPVAPGLEVPAVIEYVANEAAEHNDQIVLTVDDDIIEVPLQGYPRRPLLELEGVVDFGYMVSNSKVMSKMVTIYNHGSKSGDFKLKYTGDRPIAILPSSGTITPGEAVNVKIEYVTKQPGSFNEMVKVKLEGQEPSNLHVKGHVVEGTLQLLSHTTEEPIECVGFGSTFYGTDCTESALLFNNGPEPVCFVAVLDEDAIGQEMGVDLTQTTAGMILNQAHGKSAGGSMNELTSLVTAIPNQGMLGPYEKVPIYFRFSPRWNPSKQGFRSTLAHPPRKDFALFLQLKVIGASQGLQTKDAEDGKSNVGGQSLEVALTGTALPVMLTLEPQCKFDFGECPVGEHVDALCTLRNEVPNMPITYQFRRIAHFTTKPSSGKISAGQCQDVIFSFAPNQAGTFKPCQYVDVIGPVADNRNPFIMHLQVIHSIPIMFLGQSYPITIKKEPVYNPGITPKIANEVGMFVDTTVNGAKKSPRAAMLSAPGTKLHRIKAVKNLTNEKSLIAFPNDRAQSIRPSNQRENYKTIFTHVDRHTYVDPDYAYTDQEAAAVQAHKQYYIDFIEYLREKRRNKERTMEFAMTNNDVDIAIKPAAGIHPKKITQEEAKPDPKPPKPPNAAFKLLSTKQLSELEKTSSQKVCDGLNAVPTTQKEKMECSRILSPQQLHQVIIGPPTVDFGEVCLRSNTQKDLNIVNNLDQFIHVVVHVDCRELRQTSPLSQVVPPKSKASLPLIFESSVRGRFQRSLDYTINGFYKNHVTVFAEVVPVALHLSTDELILEPSVGLPAEAGIRGVITLRNPLNHSAEFTWSPILGERGTAFSIRPATGTVEAYKDLDCEVVFHPSFLAPEEGFFSLQVHNGASHNLKCLARLGATNVQFIDRRVMFGQVPLHLTTTRTAMIRNNSLNHAYFQVLDPNPFPGMSISPLHGVVPVGGTADLKINLTPGAIMKFDTHVQVAIRGWKTLELRMGGTVEPPCVDIDLPSFNFGGVFCGSKLSVPFKLLNKTNTKARMEFNLSRYADFSLAFPNKQTPEDYTFHLMNPGVHCITMEPNEVADGELFFEPKEVASYDFIIPVIVNQMGAPTPLPTPLPPTPAPSNKNSIQHIINPRPVHVTIETPRRKVVATALRQPLQLTSNNLIFNVSAATHEMSINAGFGHCQTTLLVNNSDKELRWDLDFSQVNPILEEGIFKFLHASGTPFLTYEDGGVGGSLEPGQTYGLGIMFCPGKPGVYETSVKVILNGDYNNPYCVLTLLGELQSAKLSFDPMAIVLTPVPLDTEVSADFQILADHYTKASYVHAEMPDVECEDGSSLSPLSVTFTAGHEVKTSEKDGEPFALPCRVTFKSPRPVSFSSEIYFVDEEGNSFKLPVTATADNCLLTCYPFLAQHRTDHQIVCEQGTSLKGRRTASRESVNVGEAILLPCNSPVRPSSRPSTTATSSNFEVSSSSYESSSQSVTESTFPSTPRDGALNKFTTESEQQSRGRNNDLTSRSLGSAVFPEEDSEEGIFHTEVLLAVQRWFSSQGWPGGPHPITIPLSLRSGLTKKPTEEKTKNAKGGTWEANNLKKEFKTVYDMIAHLCGRQVPGIPINNPLPRGAEERAKQIYWQHCTLLTFLKTQGGCVSSIKPEYLMEPADYKIWSKLQRSIAAKKQPNENMDLMKTEEEEALEDQLFEAVSKRAWTDILLQLLKTLVLSKITPRGFKKLPSPYRSSTLPMVDNDPLCSNVYGIAERIMLIWLNLHYEQQRSVIWKNCPKGGVPPSRWVVNFDFDLLDGLVLAAAIGAHAPFVVKTFLQDMYTHPSTAEQCLHNALKVVNAMHHIGIDYDIQAIDITDPNPISLLLLIVHLYNLLPQYLPRSNIEFVGALHSAVVRQVRLGNPSVRPLTYQALLDGHDAQDFSLPKGLSIVIPPKSQQNLAVEFKGRFLRPSEAVLVLVGRRQGSNVGSTLVFNLSSQVNNINPKMSFQCTTPCYELSKIQMEVTNPFTEAGEFRVILIESQDNSLIPMQSSGPLMPVKRKSKKKVRARVDHGQSKVDESPESTDRSSLEESEDIGKKTLLDMELSNSGMSAFSCPKQTIYLDPSKPSPLEVHFLPFEMGHRQATLIFVNEDIGEFLYAIDATATAPQPSAVPFKPTSHSARISSAAAAGGGRGMFGGDDRIVYWKCDVGETLSEKLKVPIVNDSRETALAQAAQQSMSDLEIARRRVTGTLDCPTVTSKAIDNLSKSGLKNSVKSSKGSVFEVEVDSQHYRVPKTIKIPTPLRRSPSAGESRAASISSLGPDVHDDGTIDLPVTFHAAEAGHYPCKITLRSQDDVRVYQIECTVAPEGAEASLEFTSPTHQVVSQDIPIINHSDHDWPMSVSIQGVGFSGPHTMVAKAGSTTYYSLNFRPQLEGKVEGKLVLTNTIDGVDHTFHLSGNGERPLPLEHLIFHCQVKQSVSKVIQIPNITRQKLHYKVESDLPFVNGPEYVTVLPGKSAEYKLNIAPNRRGSYKGVLTFVAGANPVKEVDSDGDDVPEIEDSNEMHGYRVWYSLDAHVEPAPPEKQIEITCACQKRVALEVGLTNPISHEITFDAQIIPDNQGLQGLAKVTLAPSQRGVYVLQYAPAIIGKAKASLVFFNEELGEFWYDLALSAETPAPTQLPHMECELGRWARQHITLNNPTDETLRLIPTISNTNNFVLERDNERPIELRPYSSLRLPLTFMPSCLGDADHRATITFHCEQDPVLYRVTGNWDGVQEQYILYQADLGEWIYYTSGSGRLPQPQDPVSITAIAGSNSTLIIPFRNPLDIPVLVDVILTDKDQSMKKVLKDAEMDDPVEAVLDPNETPFCLLLKHDKGMRLGPKSTLDIPISFAPEDMRMFEALITVSVRKENKAPWIYNLTEETNTSLPERCEQAALDQIQWQYPIRGYPELTAKDTQPAIVVCQARERIDERIEVTLSGVVPSVGGPKRGIKTRARTPSNKSDTSQQGVVVGEGIALAEEFTYELIYPSEDSSKNLEPAVALSLVRQQRDKHTGLVILIFNVVYAPYKTMSHDVQLLVKGATGGLWRFPLRFIATEPEPDDTIMIEAAGLNKQSSVGFRLTTQNRHPAPFNAYFVAGSDVAFSVTPQTGELLPVDTQGTLIRVQFEPMKYGKIYTGKLVVQTADMQWTYNVQGVLPEYAPPRGYSVRPMAGPHPDPRKRPERINFIRNNLKLTTTAVSSPIKGAPILLK